MPSLPFLPFLLQTGHAQDLTDHDWCVCVYVCESVLLLYSMVHAKVYTRGPPVFEIYAIVIQCYFTLYMRYPHNKFLLGTIFSWPFTIASTE